MKVIAPRPLRDDGTPAPLFIATDTVNIRSGPNPGDRKVAGSPLPTGTVVHALAEQDGWTRLIVPGTLRGITGVTGWVNSIFLRPAPQLVSTAQSAQLTR
ncbi:SH3 domain-containing protein [Longimicrobium sp.]|jgi:SH3-like domain-containing protein|uniref:SH3 domain-containing protein n=1 Tax=Longimicrobium sp. TaxID=2029185 RepID=UPI002F94D627